MTGTPLCDILDSDILTIFPVCFPLASENASLLCDSTLDSAIIYPARILNLFNLEGLFFWYMLLMSLLLFSRIVTFYRRFFSSYIMFCFSFMLSLYTLMLIMFDVNLHSFDFLDPC